MRRHRICYETKQGWSGWYEPRDLEREIDELEADDEVLHWMASYVVEEPEGSMPADDSGWGG